MVEQGVIGATGEKVKEESVKVGTEQLTEMNTEELTRMSEEAKVKETVKLFNKIFLQCVQEEKERCGKKKVMADSSSRRGSNRLAMRTVQRENSSRREGKQLAMRPDLKALSKMKNMGTILFPRKRIGDIPGVNVGHKFFSWAKWLPWGYLAIGYMASTFWARLIKG